MNTMQTNTGDKIKQLLRGGFVFELFVNGFLPWLVYTWAEPGMGRVHALMASAIPPIAWSIVEFVRKRRIDAFSIFVLAGIVLSLLAFFGGGSYRMLEMREHLVNGVIALALLGSVVIKRPILAVLGRAMAIRKSPADAEKFERKLKNPRVVRLMTRLTLGMGLLLLVKCAIVVGLVFTLPVREFLIVSPILSYALIGLVLMGALYAKRHVAPKLRAELAEAEQRKQKSDH